MFTVSPPHFFVESRERRKVLRLFDATPAPLGQPGSSFLRILKQKLADIGRFFLFFFSTIPTVVGHRGVVGSGCLRPLSNSLSLSLCLSVCVRVCVCGWVGGWVGGWGGGGWVGGWISVWVCARVCACVRVEGGRGMCACGCVCGCVGAHLYACYACYASYSQSISGNFRLLLRMLIAISVICGHPMSCYFFPQTLFNFHR